MTLRERVSREPSAPAVFDPAVRQRARRRREMFALQGPAASSVGLLVRPSRLGQPRERGPPAIAGEHLSPKRNGTRVGPGAVPESILTGAQKPAGRLNHETYPCRPLHTRPEAQTSGQTA